MSDGFLSSEEAVASEFRPEGRLWNGVVAWLIEQSSSPLLKMCCLL